MLIVDVSLMLMMMQFFRFFHSLTRRALRQTARGKCESNFRARQWRWRSHIVSARAATDVVRWPLRRTVSLSRWRRVRTCIAASSRRLRGEYGSARAAAYGHALSARRRQWPVGRPAAATAHAWRWRVWWRPRASAASLSRAAGFWPSRQWASCVRRPKAAPILNRY